MEKSEILAYSVLFVGVGLLVFTFFNAFLFLGDKIRLLSTNITEAFGEAIGPLIESCIRTLYLGIMSWIGSILTTRGIQLLTQLKREAKAREERGLSIITPIAEVAKVPEIAEKTSKSQEQKERPSITAPIVKETKAEEERGLSIITPIAEVAKVPEIAEKTSKSQEQKEPKKEG